jgi:hypothetical protein
MRWRLEKGANVLARPISNLDSQNGPKTGDMQGQWKQHRPRDNARSVRDTLFISIQKEALIFEEMR